MVTEEETNLFDEKLTAYNEVFDCEKYLHSYYGGLLDRTEVPEDSAGDEFDEDVTRSVKFKIRNMMFVIPYVLNGIDGPVNVLDIGTGPFCGNMMYLSGFDKVNNIVCSDYLNSNRQYITDVISGKVSSNNGKFRWNDFTKQIYGDKNTTMFESFQQKCRNIEHVDLSCLDEGLKDVEKHGPYQLITSEWTFSEGTRNLAEYEELLARCNRMLTIGGALIVEDVLEETFAVPDFGQADKKLTSVWVSEPWLREAMARQGFLVEQISLFYNKTRDSPYFDGLGEIFAWAVKVRDV